MVHSDCAMNESNAFSDFQQMADIERFQMDRANLVKSLAGDIFGTTL
jgi:hypothetical protein